MYTEHITLQPIEDKGPMYITFCLTPHINYPPITRNIRKDLFKYNAYQLASSLCQELLQYQSDLELDLRAISFHLNKIEVNIGYIDSYCEVVVILTFRYEQVEYVKRHYDEYKKILLENYIKGLDGDLNANNEER